VGTLAVTKVGDGAGEEAMEFDAMTNKPLCPFVLLRGVAEYGIQNPPEPLPLVAHETVTLVTFAVPTVPEPPLTAQFSPEG
jgi:hypothetical protein